MESAAFVPAAIVLSKSTTSSAVTSKAVVCSQTSKKQAIKPTSSFFSSRDACKFVAFDGLRASVSLKEAFPLAKPEETFRFVVQAVERVQPWKGDPFEGNLSTPWSDGGFVKGFVPGLPAFRSGLAPFQRGLEIGMAHGYLLAGPFVTFGPLRATSDGLLAGSLSAAGLVVILHTALAAYGLVKFQGASKGNDLFADGKGWADFSRGFLFGGLGSILFAYGVLTVL